LISTRFIDEPSLQFGRDQHICPRQGIYSFSPYDIDLPTRPDKIKIGIIGKSDSVEQILEWIEECQTHIEGKVSKNPHPNLFMNFCGFNKKLGFKSTIIYDDSYIRNINNSDFLDVIKNCESLGERIKLIAELYLTEIKYLANNKKPDVILCVLSDKFLKSIKDDDSKEETDDKEIENAPYEDKKESNYLEQNFRRYLKAKAMKYKIPIQLMRDKIVKPNASMQDPATIAWNFFTAIYYKASGTPWALIRKDFSETTCYAGVSFFQSRDRKSVQKKIEHLTCQKNKRINYYLYLLRNITIR